MDFKRIFRGPWLWIVIAVVGVLIALQYLAPNGGYDEVDTSKMSGYIDDGTVKTVTFIDRDQTIQAELDNGKKVTSSWVAGQQRDLINAAEKGVKAGSIENYQTKVAKPSLLGQILAHQCGEGDRHEHREQRHQSQVRRHLRPCAMSKASSTTSMFSRPATIMNALPYS